MSALANSDLVLQYASKRLKAERDVALAAIQKDVHALRYVTEIR